MIAALPVAFIIWAAPAVNLPSLHASFYTSKLSPAQVDVALDAEGIVPSRVRLIEDGREANFATGSKPFGETEYGLTAVIAVDTSGSMKGEPLAAVKSALHDYVASSRSRDRIAIISFADTVEVLQPFTADKEAMRKTIQGIAARGRFTVLHQALAKSLSLLSDERTNARRHVLVITDGRNEGPGPGMDALRTDANKRGIPVDCIGITRLAPQFLAPTQALAESTGGVYVRARNHGELKAAMNKGITWLSSSPVLSFPLKYIRTDGAPHALRVVVPGYSTADVTLTIPLSENSGTAIYIPVVLACLLFGSGLILVGRNRRRNEALPTGPAATGISSNPLQAETKTAKSAHLRSTRTVLAAPVAPPAKLGPPRHVPQDQGQVAIPATTSPRDAILPAGQVRSSPGETQFRHFFDEPTPAHPAVWCRGIRGPAAGVNAPVDRLELWLGSDPGNQIVLANDPAASRNHACIQWIGGDLYIRDNQSTNGTSVNGRKLDGGSRALLQPGDLITVGRSTFTLKL